ncbi:MAG: peptidylprolyl isomerase [Planctomycetaceae bacterium]|nr:peptidylprolyl isomerase [Planctomycetaceae bacterium]
MSLPQSFRLGEMIAILLCAGLPLSADDGGEFDASEWKALLEKKVAVVARIEEIGKTFQDATPEERDSLQKEAAELSNDFRKDVMPRLLELAPTAFERDPKDTDAAEIMMQITYAKNQFGKAAEIAELVLQNTPENSLALNVAGVSYFATNNFEKAVETFERAKGLEALIPQLGGRYIDSAEKYIDYWKTEQEIRAAEAAATGDDQLPQVLMKTDKGDILLELFENEAPNTVANFVSLVEKKYYDGVPFHRVISGFMAQGGQKLPIAGGINYTIDCECYRDDARRHFAGTLSMAHAGKDTGGAQFFLTHLPTPHLDRDERPESVHTVFGRVVEGMDVVAAIEQGDAIQSATVVRKRNHDYKPVTNPPSP